MDGISSIRAQALIARSMAHAALKEYDSAIDDCFEVLGLRELDPAVEIIAKVFAAQYRERMTAQSQRIPPGLPQLLQTFQLGDTMTQKTPVLLEAVRLGNVGVSRYDRRDYVGAIAAFDLALKVVSDLSWPGQTDVMDRLSATEIDATEEESAPTGVSLDEFARMQVAVEKVLNMRISADHRKRALRDEYKRDDHKDRRYDFFIAHSRNDSQTYGDDLSSGLRARGYSCFLDEWEWFGLGSSDSDHSSAALARRLVDRINHADAFVLVLGHHTFESEWISVEVDAFVQQPGTRVLHIVVIHDLAAAELATLQRRVRNVTKSSRRVVVIYDNQAKYRTNAISPASARRLLEVTVTTPPTVRADQLTQPRLTIEKVSMAVIKQLLDHCDPKRLRLTTATVGLVLTAGATSAAIRGGFWTTTAAFALGLLGLLLITSGLSRRRRGGRVRWQTRIGSAQIDPELGILGPFAPRTLDELVRDEEG